MDKTSEELLPCPFCGHSAKLSGGNSLGYYVACRHCTGSAGGRNAREAINAWNTRARDITLFYDEPEPAGEDRPRIPGTCGECGHFRDNGAGVTYCGLIARTREPDDYCSRWKPAERLSNKEQEKRGTV